ncbi:MAG: nitrous oxide reductase family maturation protein NosD [Acidimicrobiales bacterium]
MLDSDIGPCGVGLTIAADNVTLDLNGHTIRGTAASGEGPGVLLEGRTGVTVKNGAVTQFDAGVGIDGGSRNTVENMRLINNVSNFGDWGDGVAMFQSTENLVRNNLVEGNGPWSGISTTSGDRNTIDGNRIVNNNISGNQTAGIRLEHIGNNGSDGNVVTNNLSQANGTFGIQLFRAGSDNIIRGNQLLQKPFDGLQVQTGARRNTIEYNYVRLNRRDGIQLAGTGALGGATNNLIRGNSSFGNTRWDLIDGNPACDANVWTGNQAGTGTPACVFNP